MASKRPVRSNSEDQAEHLVACHDESSGQAVSFPLAEIRLGLNKNGKPGEGDRLHCPFRCRRSYVYERGLRAHLAKAHEDFYQALTEASCYICQRDILSSLREHNARILTYPDGIGGPEFYVDRNPRIYLSLQSCQDIDPQQPSDWQNISPAEWFGRNSNLNRTYGPNLKSFSIMRPGSTADQASLTYPHMYSPNCPAANVDLSYYPPSYLSWEPQLNLAFDSGFYPCSGPTQIVDQKLHPDWVFNQTVHLGADTEAATSSQPNISPLDDNTGPFSEISSPLTSPPYLDSQTTSPGSINEIYIPDQIPHVEVPIEYQILEPTQLPNAIPDLPALSQIWDTTQQLNDQALQFGALGYSPAPARNSYSQAPQSIYDNAKLTPYLEAQPLSIKPELHVPDNVGQQNHAHSEEEESSPDHQHNKREDPCPSLSSSGGGSTPPSRSPTPPSPQPQKQPPARYDWLGVCPWDRGRPPMAPDEIKRLLKRDLEHSFKQQPAGREKRRKR